MYSHSTGTTVSLYNKLNYKLKNINNEDLQIPVKIFHLKYQKRQWPFHKVNQNEIWG